MGTGGFTLLLVLAALTILPSPPPIIGSAGNGLYILVSFPNLAMDVENITCPGDRVEYIAPPGVDPHSYTLTPADRSRIMAADVVISTAHAGFEYRIRDMSRSGLLHGVLIEIPSIPGIILKRNPATGRVNLHMPIYDPHNYVVFVKYIASVFSRLNPACAGYYGARAEAVARWVSGIVNETPRLNVSALAESPYIQYAVEWAGIRVEYLLVKEHGVPATPEDMLRIREALSKGEIGLILVSKPAASSFSQQAVSLAEEYGVSTLYVPTPMSNSSIPLKLEYISGEIHVFRGGFGAGRPLSPPGSHEILRLATEITGIIILAVSIIYVWGPRRWLRG